MSNSALLRLSLVRFSASFLLILTTGILNRVLIVDLKVVALTTTVVLSFQHLTSPFALVSGYLSDRFRLLGSRRVSWIRLWTLIAAMTVPFMPTIAMNMSQGGIHLVIGIVVLGLFGFGLKAANLLVGALLVDTVPDKDLRGRYLNIIWIMAILGFVCGGLYFTKLLPVFDPASPADVQWFQQLCLITAIAVFVLTVIGTWGIEPPTSDTTSVDNTDTQPSFMQKVRVALSVPQARLIFLFLVLADFTFFVQDFVLEAFGADVFNLPISVTTSLNINFGAGMILAMIGAGTLGVLFPHFPVKRVLSAGCFLGAMSFAGLALSAVVGASSALLITVFILGLAKGLYNVGLSYLFMGLAQSQSAGVLMGVWGALGGFAVALGSLSGGVLKTGADRILGDTAISYGAVFGLEVVGMVVAGMIILKYREDADNPANTTAVP